MTMTPLRYRVDSRHAETTDTVSLDLSPVDGAIAPPRPGQFTMVYAFGVGEVPISVSGGNGAGLVHTLRAVGAVTRALYRVPAGAMLGVRGPYGSDWGLPAPEGDDLVLLGGGIGLAPLRPVIRHAVAHRSRYRRVVVLIGARTPADLLYPGEYDAWRAAGLTVRATVDRAPATSLGSGVTGAARWTGHVGVVTTLLADLSIDPDRTVAFVCGPEVMMRFTGRALLARGVPAGAVRLSLERNMRCGVALCGHCQLGPLLLCRDGPVLTYDRAAPLMEVREL
jgi:anaerobic sulfite reductase subunit B